MSELVERTIRKSTKLEISLVVLLLGQLGGAIWWARGVSSQLDTLTQAIAKYDPGMNAVLVYRVEQLERRLEVQLLQERRRQ